jgi:tetratricopeptide (TPR) repeat protein
MSTAMFGFEGHLKNNPIGGTENLAQYKSAIDTKTEGVIEPSETVSIASAEREISVPDETAKPFTDVPSTEEILLEQADTAPVAEDFTLEQRKTVIPAQSGIQPFGEAENNSFVGVPAGIEEPAPLPGQVAVNDMIEQNDYRIDPEPSVVSSAPSQVNFTEEFSLSSLISNAEYETRVTDLDSYVSYEECMDAALGYFDNGKYFNALPLFKKALGLSPDDPNANFFVGLTYFRTDDFAKAKMFLKIAIAINPDFDLAYLRLGDVISREGDLSGAWEQYKLAYSLNPALISEEKVVY